MVQSGLSRLSERVNWSTIQFLLENTVFLLIGLQARQIINNMGTTDLPASADRRLLPRGAARGDGHPDGLGDHRAGPAAVARQDDRERPPWSYSIVLGWAGLRGVVTLATALLIPAELTDRDVLVFGAMVVVAGTLLIQGLTLPHLVRRLGLRGPDPRSDALQAATVLQTASNAALTELDAITGPDDDPDVIQRVRDRIAARPEALWERLGSDDSQTPAEEYRRLRLATITTERAEVLRIRSTGTIDHAVIEEVLGSLDVEESMLTLASERAEVLDEGGPVEVPQVEEGPCHDLDDAPSDAAPHVGPVRGLRARGHSPRPPAHVPDLRQRGLLRLLGGPARHPALPADRPPGDAQLRGRRDLALVLPARATGLIRRPTRPDRPVDEVRQRAAAIQVSVLRHAVQGERGGGDIVTIKDVFTWKLHGDGRSISPGTVVAPDERLSVPITVGIGLQHVVAMFAVRSYRAG